MLTAKHTKYAKSRFSGQAVSCSRPHRFRVVRGSCIETCNGNITYMVNSSQTLAASYRYDAFGNLLSSSGSLAGANKYRFSSKEWVEIDPWTQSIPGIYYYGYRFYVPSLQRWPNRDPLGEPGFELLRGGKRSVLGDGPNRYLFVKNNPANRIDVLGLTSLLYYYQCFDKRIHPTIDSQCKCICAPTSDEDCEKQCKDCAGAAQLNPRKFCECILQVQEGYTAEKAAEACKKCPDVNLKPKKKKKDEDPDFP